MVLTTTAKAVVQWPQAAHGIQPYGWRWRSMDLHVQHSLEAPNKGALTSSSAP